MINFSTLLLDRLMLFFPSPVLSGETFANRDGVVSVKFKSKLELAPIEFALSKRFSECDVLNLDLSI